MAHRTTSLLCLSILVLGSAGLKTCPGFPGYCSESFPGQTCNVVCSFGRNNVPLCQDDGTWTDIPRCIEHEPGVDEQIPGICPGIPGYCAQGFLHQRCNFDCATGADIDSLCTSDGTWQPYPVCQGDQRETRDGCDGCPGPLGRARNRTAEALLANSVQTNRVPKSGSIGGSGNRQTVPSFAGTTRFGKIDNQPARNNLNPSSFFVGNDGTIQDRPTQAQRDQAAQRQANVERQLAIQRQQAAERQRQEAAERQRQEAAERQRQEAAERQRQEAVRRQQAAQQQQQQQTAFRQQQQQPAFRTQQQQPAQQQPFQQGLNTFQPNRPANQPLTGGGSLFNQIKNNINNGHRLRAEQEKRQQQQQQQQQPARQAGQSSLPVSNFLPEIDELLLQQQQQLEQQQQQEQLEQRRRQQQQFQQNQQQFGVFETVNLGGPPTSPPVQQPRAIQRAPSSPPANNQDFFGEFPSVNLQARI